MKLIKLHTTASTNTFLKELASDTTLENFTVVTTIEQTSGRGQMQSKWLSEKGKNLIMSAFLKFNNLKTAHKTYLNFAISVSVFEAILVFNIPKLAIKWPNDILSVNQKLCGILIENQFLGNKIVSSVVGIGLNINQENFSSALKNASSLKNILKKEIAIDSVLETLIDRLKYNIQLLNDGKFDYLKVTYLDNLYKKNTPSMFKTSEDNLFMGKIIGVSNDGNLQIELEDESVKEFELKEISFA